MKEDLTARFIRGLAQHNLTYEEVKANWKYAGGDAGSHLNYYNLCYPSLARPSKTEACVCAHFIRDNCYITDGTEFIVVGNCCIKRFVPNCSRTCDKCGEPHKNRVVNRCQACRVGRCDRCGVACNAKYKMCFRCFQSPP